MYFVLSQEEYDSKVTIDSLRIYANTVIKESNYKRYDYKNKDNIQNSAYYVGKIDAMPELLELLK